MPNVRNVQGFTRYAVKALENTTSNLLTVGRITWSGGRLQSVIAGGTNGTVIHLVPADDDAGDADYAFEVQPTGSVDDIMYIAEYGRMLKVAVFAAPQLAATGSSNCI